MASLAAILVIGFAEGVAAWLDCKSIRGLEAPIHGLLEAVVNPEGLIPCVIEDYEEECRDFSEFKEHGENGSFIWPEKVEMYRKHKSEADIPSPLERAKNLAKSGLLQHLQRWRMDVNRFWCRIAFVALSALAFVAVMAFTWKER